MSWSSPYVIFRHSAQNVFVEVHKAEEIKDAKYWLAYIAKPGDVLCRTPLHPKHTRSSDQPEYWSHKSAKGVVSDERLWRQGLTKEGITPQFEPAPQAKA